MTRVLALDLARLTGWAVGDTEDGVESFGTHEFPRAGDVGLGEYGMAARMTFRRMLVEVAPELVVKESVILRSGKIKQRGNGKAFVATVDTPDKLQKIYGLPFELKIECYRAGIPVDEANVSTVRDHFLLGHVPRSSEECKIAVKVMSRRRGWNIRDDNEADVLAVLDWKLAKLAPSKWSVLKINAGESTRMSSSGADVFARSSPYSRPATKTAGAENSPSSSDGPAAASSTGQRSPGKTTGTIRRFGAGMSSILSGSQAELKLRAPEELELRRSRR